MRQRDTQRSKVYAAQSALDQHTEVKLTLPECVAFVKKVQARAALRDQFGYRLTDDITVHHGAGNRHATADSWNRVIKLPKWARQKRTILHEIAHLVTPSDKAGHGAEFAANYLTLVRAILGVEAAEQLQAAFNLHGVKVWCNGAARKPRVPKSQAEWHAARKAQLDASKAEAKAEAALAKQVIEAAVAQQPTVACPTCGDHREVKVRHYQTLRGWNYVTKTTVYWNCDKDACSWSVYKRLTPSLATKTQQALAA